MLAFQPKNILVSGGAGFIGANFIHYLLKNHDDCFIFNLDALTYAGDLNNLTAIADHPRYQFFQGNICDAALVTQIMKHNQIDTIVHFAAESHVDNSIASPRQFIETNVLGTFTLLNCAKNFWLDELKLTAGQHRFHHISTDEVYGSLAPDAPSFTEHSLYQPNSPYSASKAGSDHLVRAYHKTYGLSVTLSNCSNNYGPYQHAEKFIPTVIRHCQQQTPIPIYGDGSNIRDWLYVEDHCRGIDAIIRQGKNGENYNLGGDYEVSNLAIAKQICQLMDDYFPDQALHQRLIKFIQDRPGHDFRYSINYDKVHQGLNWQPQVEFHQGLSQTIEFYLELLKN